MKTFWFMAVLMVVSVGFGKPLNILFITMDDMNWDSIESYGCSIPDIAPHIDGLAGNGLRFTQAFVQSTACVPSRNVFQTGRYPHTSGVRGFFCVDVDFKIVPELLREGGYVTAAINKARDSSPNAMYEKFWDTDVVLLDNAKRTPENYKKPLDAFLAEMQSRNQPFYCMVNIADPHKPFFRDPKAENPEFDKHAPSIIYNPEDVKIPPFLPEHPKVRQEMANYYSSVRRGDDCVGVVLESLRNHGFEKDTVIIFVSDHGMALPYAKSSMYPDGVRTPWIVVWPGKVKAGSVDREHMISAIDFAPTVLDIAGVEKPEGLQGRSILPVIEQKKQDNRDVVFTEFNESAGGVSQPMRAVYTKKFAYIFNAWATGDRKFICAANWYNAYGVMKELAGKNPAVKARFDFLDYRTVEELYDLEQDPHALNNLIDDPTYKKDADKLRTKLATWMRDTDDYLLPAFRVRNEPDRLEAFMVAADSEALKRAETIEWKRWNNRAGPVEGDRVLYKKTSK